MPCFILWRSPAENPSLTDMLKYGKILSVAEYVQCATVAQLVEQLTRNEQVVRSNRISSSKKKSLKVGLWSQFSGIFVYQGQDGEMDS